MVGPADDEGRLHALDQSLGIGARILHQQPRHLADQAPADQAMVAVDLQAASRPPGGAGGQARRRGDAQRDTQGRGPRGGPSFSNLFALHSIVFR